MIENLYYKYICVKFIIETKTLFYLLLNLTNFKKQA